MSATISNASRMPRSSCLIRNTRLPLERYEPHNEWSTQARIDGRPRRVTRDQRGGRLDEKIVIDINMLVVLKELATVRPVPSRSGNAP
jgi:hypothetical protein